MTRKNVFILVQESFWYNKIYFFTFPAKKSKFWEYYYIIGAHVYSAQIKLQTRTYVRAYRHAPRNKILKN